MKRRAKEVEIDVVEVAPPQVYTLGQVFLISIGTTVAGGILLWLVKSWMKPAKPKSRGLAKVVPMPRSDDDE